MKLSIITINFNNKSGLEKTIKSVISQKFHDFEYIIIDGGSSDGSVDIIKKYSKHFNYWVSEPDSGIFQAMNKGIKQAKGEYLQFLNSGDWLVDDNVLEDIFKDMVSCDIIYGNCRMILENGDIQYDNMRDVKLNFRTFFKASINHQSTFISKKMFDKYGLYDESLKLASDWKFFFIAMGLNPCYTIYKDVDIVYYNREGVSSNQRELLFEERNKVINALVPINIQTYFRQQEDEFIRLDIIKKHKISSKLYRLSQIILVRFSRLLDLFSS